MFDLDGTLVRSGEDIAAAVNFMRRSLGLPALTDETIRGFVGDGIRVLIQKALGSEAADRLDPALQLFAAHYAEHLLDHTRLYPHVCEILDHFRDKSKVIITNKREHYSRKIARGLGIEAAFLEIIGEGSTPYQKPDPRLLALVMEKWRAVPARTVVIGDGINDVLLAKRGGALSCAFLNGLTPRETLLSHHPDLTCEDLSDLAFLLQ